MKLTPNPERETVIEIWLGLPEPKPSMTKFCELLAGQGIKVPYDTIRKWFARGVLPREAKPIHIPRGAVKLPDGTTPAQVDKIVRGIIDKAKTDADIAARIETTFTRAKIIEIMGRTLTMSEAMIRKMSDSIDHLQVKNVTQAAVLVATIDRVLERVAKISEELRLLEALPANAKEVKGSVSSFQEALEAHRKKSGK